MIKNLEIRDAAYGAMTWHKIQCKTWPYGEIIDAYWAMDGICVIYENDAVFRYRWHGIDEGYEIKKIK